MNINISLEITQFYVVITKVADQPKSPSSTTQMATSGS